MPVKSAQRGAAQSLLLPAPTTTLPPLPPPPKKKKSEKRKEKKKGGQLPIQTTSMSHVSFYSQIEEVKTVKEHE